MENLALQSRGMTKKEKTVLFAAFAVITVFAVIMILNPAFAANDYADSLKDVIQKFIDIVLVLFQSVGVMFTVYGAIQLILAMKNDNPDDKSRASVMIGVGLALIFAPAIVNALDLVDMIGEGVG